MKAISLWQPWASLMAAGAKRIETRNLRPLSNMVPVSGHQGIRELDEAANEAIQAELARSSQVIP